MKSNSRTVTPDSSLNIKDYSWIGICFKTVECYDINLCFADHVYNWPTSPMYQVMSQIVQGINELLLPSYQSPVAVNFDTTLSSEQWEHFKSISLI